MDSKDSKQVIPRRSSWHLWVLLWLLMVAAGGFAAFYLVGLPAPRLELDGNGAVGQRGPLKFHFNQPIDLNSFKHRVSFLPPLKGSWQAEGSTFVFTPTESLIPGQVYSIQMEAGVQAENGRRTRRVQQWQFSVRQPALLFIGEALTNPEVWISDETGERALTQSNGQVVDFAGSADGARIAYTVLNAEGGTSLWLLDRNSGEAQLLLDCGSRRCEQPEWSQDGRILVFVQREGSGEMSPPSLWRMDVNTRTSTALFDDSSLHGEDPSFSPDGHHLAYYDLDARGIRVLDLAGGNSSFFATTITSSGEWSMDGGELLFADEDTTTFQPYVLAFVADLESEEISSYLTGLAEHNELSQPVWGPDDGWVTSGARPVMGEPGKQIWLIRLEDEQVIEVTADAANNHAAYRWDASGQRLAMQRYHLGSSNSLPEVMVWERSSGELVPIAENASQPVWLP